MKTNHFSQRILAMIFGASLLVAVSGGCMAQGPNAMTGAPKTMSPDKRIQTAQEVLEKLIHAYESGESTAIESFVDSTLVGVQTLTDNIRDTQTHQKQIRVFLKDIQAATGADEVVISFLWEKRYLTLPSMTPKLVKGHSSFTMVNTLAGWHLTGMAGDNIFSAYAM